MARTADQEFDRLMQLLDVGLDQLRKGDGQSTVLALEEALKTAEHLPKKKDVICLPQREIGEPL